MGHPGARSGGGGVGEGATIEMCHSGAFTFTYCPHSAPTTPEMMIKIDGLSIERKKECRGIPGICAKMAVHVKHSVVPRYRLPGGGVVETAVVLQTGCTSRVGL